jgi:hypothetical protein
MCEALLTGRHHADLIIGKIVPAGTVKTRHAKIFGQLPRVRIEDKTCNPERRGLL